MCFIVFHAASHLFVLFFFLLNAQVSHLFRQGSIVYAVLDTPIYNVNISCCSIYSCVHQVVCI